MDDINALNNKLQSISRTLEAIQTSGLRQEEAIRKCKKEREIREKRKTELSEQVHRATAEKGNVLQELEVEFATTKKLEIEWESVQFSLTQMPSLIAKESNDYERFSKRTSHHIRDLHSCLLKNGFWAELQKDANTAADNAKQTFLHQRTATKEDSVHKEESLRNQLEIEETKLAYLEFCASALPTSPPVTHQVARQVTPPSIHKPPVPPTQRSRFSPPYASNESAGAGAGAIASSPSPTLPAVTPARASTGTSTGIADCSPLADWEDRSPGPVSRLSSPPTVPPPHPAGGVAAEKLGAGSKVQSLFANYAPLYPRVAPADASQDAQDAEPGDDAAAVCDTQEMDVDYDFTDRAPIQSAPHSAARVHRHGEPAIEIAISTTTTTVTEYTMQRVPPLPPAYSSTTTAEYAHHSRHPSGHNTDLDGVYPEETVFSQEAYEEQTRLRQQEVPWFKEFKRRRTANTTSAVPVPLLGSDMRSAFDSFGHTAPIPVVQGSSQWQGASPGMLAPRSASLSTPAPRLSSFEAQHGRGSSTGPQTLTQAGTGPGLFDPRSTQQCEVADLYDASDTDEADQAQDHQRSSARLPPSGQHHQQRQAVARGSTTGAAFRSAPTEQSRDQRGNRGGQELHTMRQEDSGMQGRDSRRGFRTGLDIMQAAKVAGPSFRASMPTSASAFTMIDD